MSEHVTGKILLIVEVQQRKTHYLALLDENGADCHVVNSLQEAIVRASEEPHCGVLVDIPLMIKASSSTKSDIEDLLSGLPAATLNIHASGSMHILPRGTLASSCSSIDQFLKICTEFSSKIIFPRKRKTIYFNVLLDTDQELSSPEKTVCIDISAGGCFVFCVREDIAVGDTVWIKLPDILCDSPIMCVVCWMRTWGTTQNIPGIGLKFENISDELKKTIWDRCLMTP